MNTNTIVKKFIRKAKHDWCCDKCHAAILTGNQYLDKETHYVTNTFNGVTSTIMHERFCAVCAGYAKAPKLYKFKEPEPVRDFTDNMKYLLIGTGYKPGTKDLYLIAKDWSGTKYHWKNCLWTVDGDLLKPSNVEFI